MPLPRRQGDGELSGLSLALVAVVAVVWVQCYRLVVRKPFDAVALAMYFFAFDFLLRPLVLGLGLDRPFPDFLFAGSSTHSVVAQALGLGVLWLILFTAGHVSLAPLAAVVLPVLPQAPRRAPSAKTLLLLATVLSVLAAATTAVLVILSGDIAAFTAATKVDRAFANMQWLRSFSFVAATVAAAAYLRILQTSGRKGPRTWSLLLFMTAAGMSYIWGARDVAVFGAAGLLVGRMLFLPKSARRSQGLAKLVRKRQLVVAVVVCLVLGFGLRLYRDVVLYEEVQATIVDQSLARQYSVALNNTSFDALALAIRTWPNDVHHNEGSDFIRALPGPLSLDQPNYVSPAVQLAQHHVPTRQTGWPMSAVGEWYVNFGIFGVAIGAALSGALFRALQHRFRHFEENPLVWMTSLMLISRVFQTGIWTNSVARYAIIGVPLMLVAHVAHRLSRRRNLNREEVSVRKLVAQ
jgi:oligosaccharide repeat unit polymerase